MLRARDTTRPLPGDVGRGEAGRRDCLLAAPLLIPPRLWRGIRVSQFGYLPPEEPTALLRIKCLSPFPAWEAPLLQKDVSVRKLTLKSAIAGLGAATVGAVFAAAAVVAPTAADASSASKPSTSVLVPASAAKGAGFTKVVNAPFVSTATNVTGCPDGAQEEFASKSGLLSLISEVLYCTSAADATKLLQGIASSDQMQSGLRPPKALGSTAVARVGTGSTYLMAWRRGTAVEVTGLSTSQPSSSTTQHHHADAAHRP